MTPFSQSTQAWKLRAEEDQRRYAAKFEIDAVKKNLTKSVGGDPNDVVDLSADILRKPGIWMWRTIQSTLKKSR